MYDGIFDCILDLILYSMLEIINQHRLIFRKLVFQATGTIEPQKVEVPMSGCIMMPTASPQSRSVPMPTYEAPLVSITYIYSINTTCKNRALQ